MPGLLTCVAVTAKQVGYCLKNIHDGGALRRSSLIELPVVAAVANEKYRGLYWGHTSALRDVLIEACARLEAGVDGNAQTRGCIQDLGR